MLCLVKTRINKKYKCKIVYIHIVELFMKKKKCNDLTTLNIFITDIYIL